MFLSAAYNAMPLGYAINTSQYNYVSGSIDIPAVDHVHHSESKQGFIGVISHATKKYSYRVFQLCPSQVRKVRRLAILSGDFVRLIHQERVGELICRVDDGEQLERVIAPLGSAIKKHSRNKDEVYDVYVRTDPSFKGSSGISLWQILKEDRLHFGNLIITDTILLRHAVSGQYLCLKPFNRGGPALLGWYVSTSETPSDNCLFSMHSLDKTDVEQETDLSIGAIRFNQNISFVHAKSNLCLSAHPNPNSSALYKDDYPIEASTIKGSKTEVYKLVKVPPEQVHDALFISRMVPLLRAAITDIQLRPTNHIYLPLFRHLSTTVEVIIRWLGGLAESDFRSPKTLKMTDAHSSKLRFSSSLAVWLGRHAAEFEPLDFNYSPASSRESCESALLATPNRFRQNTVSDICLLDMFFHFANIVYTIGVVRGATSNVIDQKKLTIPVVVNNVCIMIHDLFHVCSLKNSNAALRVLTTKGALQSLVAHECNLWHPPIAVILNAAIESGDVLSIHEVEKSLLELTDFDVRLFVRQMEQLRREGREASHVLGLMDTLSRYGTSKMIKRFQDFIVAESFESVRVPSYGNYVSDEFCRNTSIFFSTRYNTSTGTWEVSLKDTSIELHSAKPEKDTYIHFFLNEVDGLDECFDGYNADSNAVLDMEECFELLEELGLAGSFLLQSVLELQGANRFRLMKWWWENRNLYFSTYSAVLNEVPFEEVREMFIQSAPRRKSLDGNNLNPFKLESLAAAKPSKGVMFGGWSKPSLTTGKDAVKSSNSMNLPVTSTPAPVAHLTDKEKIFDIAEVNDYIGLKLNSRVCNFKVGHAPFQRENGGGKRRFDESGEVTFTHPLLSTGDKEGKSSHLPPWLTVNSLLESSGSEMSWFVRCLQLFCQLCFGKNLGK